MSMIDNATRKTSALREARAATQPAAAADEVKVHPLASLAVTHRASFRLRVSERKVVLMFVDMLLVNVALMVAAALFGNLEPTVNFVTANIKWFVALTVVWYGVATFFDDYSLSRAASATASLKVSLLSASVTVVVYTFIPYFTPEWGARSAFFAQLALTVGAIAAWRVTYARVFVQPSFQQRAIVVGAGKAGRALAAAIQAAPANDANPYRGTGYQLLGFIDDDPAQRSAVVEGVPVLGDHRALALVAKQLHVDEIIVAITHRHAIEDDLFNALLHCRELGFRVVTMPTVYERLTGRLPIDHVGRDLEMVVPMDDNAGERAYQAGKRLMDIVLGAVGLLLMGLVIIPVAISNARTSPGPLFYRQRRVGQGGKIFEVYKFRSMRPDAERGTGAVWAQKNDNRITPAGRILRKTRLDEMPQFINVLKGEMSVIGPRPERPEFVNALSLLLPFYRARHAVKPGITGWAQIRYGYGSTNEDSHVKLEFDLYYVKHASPLLDLRIVLQTVPVMLLGKGQ
ncbi:MAG: sugar transferase [Chloroflexi bacterium]|nr:sugar transferase [Chloroflexota bacterium]